MMKFQPLIVSVAVVLLCLVAPMCLGETAECKKLKQIARDATLRRMNGYQMYCLANDACTGINCNGQISMHQAGYDINTEFCFGFEIQNCMKPTNVDFYSYIPSLPENNRSWRQRVTHSERREITGATVDLKVMKLVPFANITLVDEPGNKILFGLGLAMRVTYLDGSNHWPPNLHFNLIPPTEIPVAPCNTPTATLAPPANRCIPGPKSTAAPQVSSTHPPKTIQTTAKSNPTGPSPKPHKGKSTTGPPKSTAAGPRTERPTTAAVTSVPVPKTTPHHGPYPGGSKTYGKQCNPNKLTSCEFNEVCLNKKCRCAVDMKYTKGRCTGKSDIPPTKHSVLPTTVATESPIDNGTLPGNHTVVNAQSDKNHKTIVIATCTAAGVLLLAGIAVTAFIIIRKKRTRYADHDILLQNDDSEILT